MRTKRSCCSGLLLMAVSGVLVGSGVVLGSGVVFADNDSVVDDVNIVVPTACTLAGTLNTAHNATINPGTYQADIGTTTLKALCNDNNGFAIYATGYTGNTIGETNSNKLVGQNTSELIPTGIGTSGDSQWAMKLTTDSGATYPITIGSAPNTNGGADASFSSYHVVPNEYTKVAYRTEGTDVGNNATGSVLTTTYAVNIASTQSADTYSGKVIYTLVHPNNAPAPVTPLAATDCPANKICYVPNHYEIIGSMDSISSTKIAKSPTAGVQVKANEYNGSIYNNSDVTLIAPNYSRTGYGFAGWSPEFDATTATNPTIYGPNETITVGNLSRNGLILYPVWIEREGNLQGWTGCSSLITTPKPSSGNTPTLASMTALTDLRDGNTYAVARLADGNCWMVENLRLNAEDTLGATNKSFAQGYGVSTAYGNFTGLAASEDTNFSDTNPPVANSLYSIDGSTTNTIQGGNSSHYYARMPRYNNNNTNRSLTASHNGTGSDTYYQWYSYGNYYTWPAAMANTGYFTTYSDSESASTSLCPTGWRLPTGGNTTRVETDGNSDFWNLVVVNLNDNNLPVHYDDNETRPYYHLTDAETPLKLIKAFPNNFVYSGYFSNSSANGRGVRGIYESSSSFISSGHEYQYGLMFYLPVFPGTSNINRHTGGSIRCLASS